MSVADAFNPFAGYGRIVDADRFIGRERQIRQLRQRVLAPNTCASVAIVGEARIGKTSLAHKVFSPTNPDVIAVKGLISEFNIGALNLASPDDLFQQFVKRTQMALRRVSPSDAEVMKLFADEATRDRESILTYFEELKTNGYRTIFVLDEFDSIESVFRENVAAFQFLRQLGYDPRYGIALVTTSRITIGNIETQSLISTLAGIFQDINLGLMSDDEINALLVARLANSPFGFTKNERERLLRFTGNHPFFLEVAANSLWDVKQAHDGRDLPPATIDRALEDVLPEVFEKFDNFRTRMSEDRFKTLLGVTHGPAIHVSQLELSRLIQLGHIVAVENRGCYSPFSNAYHTYLSYYARQTDLWPLWTRTERGLRLLVERTYDDLARRRGSQLPAYLEQFHSRLYERYRQYKDQQERERKLFQRAGHIFDYMNPGDISDFIFAEWDAFSTVFGGRTQQDAVRKQLEHLREIRNPYAHSRDAVVTETARRKAEVICTELCDLLGRCGIQV